MSEMNEQDLLNRDQFVSLLKDIVAQKSKSAPDGFSFAIDGKWGCGKSFILNMLEKQLREDGYLVLHYNSWKNNFYDEPLMAILSVLIDELERLVAGAMDQGVFPRVKSCLNFLKTAAGVVFEYKTGLNVKDLCDAGEKVFSDEKLKAIPHDFDPMRPLKTAVDGVREHLSMLKNDFKGILITVDELDRCLPEYAIKILERLHHVCHGTPVVLLTALNKEELAASISVAFGKTYGGEKKIQMTHRKWNGGDYHSDATITDAGWSAAQSRFADYYLLKFIQIVIPVPRASISENPLALLKSLENEFNQEHGFVKLDFIQSFITDVLDSLPMRDKENVVNRARTLHQVTSARMGNTIKPTLGILCVELVDSLFRFAGRSKGAVVKFDHESGGRYKYFFDIGYAKDSVAEALASWSTSHCFGDQCSIYGKSRMEYRGASDVSPSDYVKSFFFRELFDKDSEEEPRNSYRFDVFRVLNDSEFAVKLRETIAILEG